MFDDMPPISAYTFFAEEAYTIDASFETIVGFLKFLANDAEENLPLKSEILVIALKEGVFIRTSNARWCEKLTALVKEPAKDFPVIKLFPLKKLDDVTRDYRRPLQAFGDDRLVRWKIGF